MNELMNQLRIVIISDYNNLYFFQIDCSAILFMSDEELGNFIPAYGDRLAIKHFASKKATSKKKSLIEKLKLKMSAKNSSIKQVKEKPVIHRNRKTKVTRIIEIGWYCMNQKLHRYRQVKMQYGGGTRRVPMKKESKCSEILEVGKELFFPNGSSTKGPLESFDVELLDYKCHKFDVNMTIEQMYDVSRMSTLRFYLATTRKSGYTSDDDDNYYISETIIGSSSVHQTQTSNVTTVSTQVASNDISIFSDGTHDPILSSDFSLSRNNSSFNPRRSERLKESNELKSYVEEFFDDEVDNVFVSRSCMFRYSD